MGFVFIWLECVAVGVLLTAVITACSSRRKKRWTQVLGPALVLVLLAVKSALVISMATVLAIHGSRPDWRFYAWSMGLITLGAAAVVFWRGLGLRQRVPEPAAPPARAWPRAKLAVALLAAVGLTAATLGNMDNAVRIKLAGLRSEAGALALSVAPSRVPDRRNAAILYDQAFAAAKEYSPGPGAKKDLYWDSRSARLEAVAGDPAIAAHLDRNRGALELLRRAAAMEDCYFEHGHARPSFSMLFPEVLEMRKAARLLRLEAERQAAGGNPRKALENIAAIRRMAEHIRSEPIL
ncbi:MAG: hypothetical protein ACYTGB_12685, partial [Planctomycetota bacterium]